MIRGLPFRFVLFLLFSLWIVFSLAIAFLVPRLKGEHLKIMLYGLSAAIAGLVVVVTFVSTLVVFFN